MNLRFNHHQKGKMAWNDANFVVRQDCIDGFICYVLWFQDGQDPIDVMSKMNFYEIVLLS
jgi:hypothetical protein